MGTSPLREVAVGGDSYSALLTGYGDRIAELSSFAADFDPLLEKLLQGSDVHDLVLHRLRAVDEESRSLLLSLRRHSRTSTHLHSQVTSMDIGRRRENGRVS